MGELLRLMDQAKLSGVLEQLLQSMVVSEAPSGSMTDAAKRRKDVHEELVVHSESHSDSDWDEVDNPTKDDLQWMAKLGMRQKAMRWLPNLWLHRQPKMSSTLTRR